MRKYVKHLKNLDFSNVIRKRGFMKKILLSLAALFLFNASANAATTIIENYDATKLKQDIIKIYALRGALIESNKLDEFTFTIKQGFSTGWDNYLIKKDITIIQNNKDCIINLNAFLSSSFYRNLKIAGYVETKELNVLEKELKGGYTYGLSYFIKPCIEVNKKYMSDGIDSNGVPIRISDSNISEPRYMYTIVPKSTIGGPKLISTSYSAKEQGLKAKNRIVEINDKHIKKYKPQELSTLLNPTKAGQTIKVGYKEKCGAKVKHVTLESKYQKPILENL